MSRKLTSMTYKEAGVDIKAAEAFVDRIGTLASSTHTSGVVRNLSRFSGLFRPDFEGVTDPLLAATCDGVGTKLLVARDVGRFDTLGQDLVAMNVNDLIVLGARPLFFLDYIATGILDAGQLEELVGGIAAACREVGCALLGGETAEMPGLYAAGDFDLAGFAVGLADGTCLPKPETVAVGDVVIGLPSSGIHSNGLSLARKALIERGGMKLDEQVEALGRTLGDELLEPTALYVEPVTALQQRFQLKAAAHVTGGGIVERGRALLRDGQQLVVEPLAEVPKIFELIREAGEVAPEEMARTFNMGLGFLVVMDAEEAAVVLEEIGAPWQGVGVIAEGSREVVLGDLRA